MIRIFVLNKKKIFYQSVVGFIFATAAMMIINLIIHKSDALNFEMITSNLVASCFIVCVLNFRTLIFEYIFSKKIETTFDRAAFKNFFLRNGFKPGVLINNSKWRFDHDVMKGKIGEYDVFVNLDRSNLNFVMFMFQVDLGTVEKNKLRYPIDKFNNESTRHGYIIKKFDIHVTYVSGEIDHELNIFSDMLSNELMPPRITL